MSFFAWEWKIILIPVPCFETAAWDIDSNIWLAGIFIKYWIDSRLIDDLHTRLINRLLTDDSLIL